VVGNEAELRSAIDAYLLDPRLDSIERRKFLEEEITFTDGSSGRRTADFILKVLNTLEGSGNH
jgi:hypothetical protein